MTKSNCWKNYPLPPNWEQKYDPNSKLNYYIDHVKKQTTWVDPRSWYYGNGQKSAVEQEIAASDDYETLQESDDGLERNESLKLSCAAKTNSVVNKFLNEGYDPKHDQLCRRQKISSLTSRKSSSRKQTGRNLETQSFSTSPSTATTSTVRMQRQSLKADLHRSTANTSLKKKKNDSASTLSPKSEPRSEAKTTGCLRSLPGPEEVNKSPVHSKLEQESDKTTEPAKSKSSDTHTVNGGETKQEESRERKELDKSSRASVQSSLLIQAIGPNRSLLIQRAPAQGPNPALHKGRGLNLAKGHNPSLLLKNQCNFVHAI